MRYVELGDIPHDAITHEDSFKNWLVRKGYIVNTVKRDYCIHAIVAKANVSLDERRKLQKQIDEKPQETPFFVNVPSL